MRESFNKFQVIVFRVCNLCGMFCILHGRAVKAVCKTLPEKLNNKFSLKIPRFTQIYWYRCIIQRFLYKFWPKFAINHLIFPSMISNKKRPIFWNTYTLFGTNRKEREISRLTFHLGCHWNHREPIRNPLRSVAVSWAVYVISYTSLFRLIESNEAKSIG